MLVGANALQRAAQVPSALSIALNGLIVVFVVSSAYFQERIQRWRADAPMGDEADAPSEPSSTAGEVAP